MKTIKNVKSKNNNQFKITRSKNNRFKDNGKHGSLCKEALDFRSLAFRMKPGDYIEMSYKQFRKVFSYLWQRGLNKRFKYNCTLKNKRTGKTISGIVYCITPVKKTELI